MPDIMHLVTIQAPPERVYQALTTAEGIRNWWMRDADLDPRVGGTCEVRWAPGLPIRLGIEALDPPARVSWKTLSSFRPEWLGTTLTFDLEPRESGTALLLAHRGFQVADAIFARTTTGWGYYLVSLKQYLETGEGAPHPDVDFSRMLG